MLALYRRTGADLPFMDPRGYHGVDGGLLLAADARAVGRGDHRARAGVDRDGEGRTWGTVGVAGHPGGFSRSVAVGRASADRSGIGVVAGDRGVTRLRADEHALSVDLGADARLDVRFADPVLRPRAAFGGIGTAQAIPRPEPVRQRSRAARRARARPRRRRRLRRAEPGPRRLFAVVVVGTGARLRPRRRLRGVRRRPRRHRAAAGALDVGRRAASAIRSSAPCGRCSRCASRSGRASGGCGRAPPVRDRARGPRER